jgi:hypothetical protein
MAASARRKGTTELEWNLSFAACMPLFILWWHRSYLCSRRDHPRHRHLGDGKPKRLIGVLVHMEGSAQFYATVASFLTVIVSFDSRLAPRAHFCSLLSSKHESAPISKH